MYAGIWAGSMCLTEAHAGTDLGLIRTKAEPQADGSYKISGSKIFITGGEHDLTENIIHLVLARLPDAPAGPKGISLFLVPKCMVNADGTPGRAQRAVLRFDRTQDGHQGLRHLRDELRRRHRLDRRRAEQRPGGDVHHDELRASGRRYPGPGLGERSYQNAVEYARDRLQSRAPTGAQNKDKVADPIIVHPDVRRMLLTMKASNEGGRAFSTYVAMQLDTAKFSEDATDPQARARTWWRC